MRHRQNKFPSIHVSGSFCVYLSVILLLLPLRWTCAFLLSAITHELFHLFAAFLLGIRINRIELGSSGAKIYTPPLTDLQELLCALSGPVGGLLPVILLRIYPEAALWALLLTVYNMLPIYPSDGGRALRSTLYIFLPLKIADKICYAVEFATGMGMIILGIYAAFVLKLGITVLIICIQPLIRRKIPKRLANKKKKEYNSAIHI